MNRRKLLQVLATLAVTGIGIRASGQVPGWKICHEKGHQMGSKTYTTDYPVSGYPGCKKRLHSTKCPRCNSDWTFKVTMEGVCPKGDDDAC